MTHEVFAISIPNSIINFLSLIQMYVHDSNVVTDKCVQSTERHQRIVIHHLILRERLDISVGRRTRKQIAR